MKNLIFLLIILTANVGVFAQDEKANITNLNRQTVALFNSGKTDEAEKTARKAVELSEKFYGTNHPETAVAYINLGVLQRQKGNYEESAKTLQNALNIYLKRTNSPPAQIIDLYELLAFSQFLNKNKTEAEKSYLAGFDLAENKFGVESKESFNPTLNLASFYARNSDFDKADDYYLKSYRTAKKNFGADSQQTESVADARICSTTTKDRKTFETEYNKIFEISGKPGPEKVVNGKAKKLSVPPYPKEAKDQRLSGTIKIRVQIDEQGNVVEAHSICGKGILETVSEQAARVSTFTPTLLNGSPVKVSGIIIYNFQRQ